MHYFLTRKVLLTVILWAMPNTFKIAISSKKENERYILFDFIKYSLQPPSIWEHKFFFFFFFISGIEAKCVCVCVCVREREEGNKINVKITTALWMSYSWELPTNFLCQTSKMWLTTDFHFYTLWWSTSGLHDWLNIMTPCTLYTAHNWEDYSIDKTLTYSPILQPKDK